MYSTLHVLTDLLKLCAPFLHDLKICIIMRVFKLSHRYIVDLVVFGEFLKGGGHKFFEFACLKVDASTLP